MRMADYCDDCGAVLPVSVSFDPDAYRRAAELVSAMGYGDAGTVDRILDGAGRDLASAMLVMLYSAVWRFAEIEGTAIADQLRILGHAAAVAAAEEEQ